MNDLFETALRKRYRFESLVGLLSLEQVWELPLTSTRGADLDGTARLINTELKSVTEESFVATKHNAAETELSNKLEIVKHIIAVKIQEAEKAKLAVERAEKRRKLLDALNTKKDQALSEASIDELEKQLAELDG